MSQAKKGDTVQVHYTGRLTDGTQFDSSAGRDPLSFTLGSGQVIPGFDEGVSGMLIGDKKTITIPFMDAYGPSHEENIIKFDRQNIPADLPVEVGMTLNMHQDGGGQVIEVVVRAVEEDHIVLDANHPLAGKDLIFDLELVAIG